MTTVAGGGTGLTAVGSADHLLTVAPGGALDHRTLTAGPTSPSRRRQARSRSPARPGPVAADVRAHDDGDSDIGLSGQAQAAGPGRLGIGTRGRVPGE